MMRRAIAIAGVAGLLAMVVTSPLSAEGVAGKVVLQIDLKGAPEGGNPAGGGGTFTLRSGATSDKGIASYSFFGTPTRGNITLTSKHGGLVLRTSSRPSGLSVDSQGLDLWTGTWTIASGTGTYAVAHGVGAYVGIIGPSYKVALHFEGFRT